MAGASNTSNHQPTPIEQAAAAERALEHLLLNPTLLLAPSTKERDAALQATSLLFSMAKGFRGDMAGKRSAFPSGLSNLHTAGCDAEQVWGQLEIGGLMDEETLKRQVKALLKSQDQVELVPPQDEENEETEEDEDEADEGSSDDDMAREAAKMRRLARGEAVSDDEEDGDEDEGEEVDEDEEEDEDDDEKSGKSKSKSKHASKKGGKKAGSEDAFWDDMEKFVQQGEDEEAEEEEAEMRSKKKGGKKAVEVEVCEANADMLDFIVAGCGIEDVAGVYRRVASGIMR